MTKARARPLDTSVPRDLADRDTVKTMLDDASVGALHAALWSMAGTMVLGGLISAAGIRNPKPQA